MDLIDEEEIKNLRKLGATPIQHHQEPHEDTESEFVPKFLDTHEDATSEINDNGIHFSSHSNSLLLTP